MFVDFVEFTDGSTWGQDLSNSGHLLTSFRAVAKAALEYLHTVEKSKGVDAAKSLDELLNLTAPEKQGSGWRLGMRFVSRKIKEVYEKSGSKAVEAELDNNIFQK